MVKTEKEFFEVFENVNSKAEAEKLFNETTKPVLVRVAREFLCTESVKNMKKAEIVERLLSEMNFSEPTVEVEPTVTQDLIEETRAMMEDDYEENQFDKGVDLAERVLDGNADTESALNTAYKSNVSFLRGMAARLNIPQAKEDLQDARKNLYSLIKEEVTELEATSKQSIQNLIEGGILACKRAYECNEDMIRAFNEATDAYVNNYFTKEMRDIFNCATEILYNALSENNYDFESIEKAMCEYVVTKEKVSEPKSVIEKIELAKDEHEIERILKDLPEEQQRKIYGVMSGKTPDFLQLYFLRELCARLLMKSKESGEFTFYINKIASIVDPQELFIEAFEGDKKVHPVIYWAYKKSKGYGNEILNFDDIPNDENILRVINTLKNAGVTELTISNASSGLMRILKGFVTFGYELSGMVEVKSINGVVPAILLKAA